MANNVWQAAIPRWNCELTFVKDFNGRIIANMEEKTTVKEPAVK